MKRCSDLAWNTIADQVVIMEDREQKVFHEFNLVGSFIWNRIDEKSENEIAQELAVEFDIDEASALEDTQNFLKDLAAKNLIQ